MSLILGNLCCLLAMITDSFSTTRNKAKEILLIQCLTQLLYCMSSIFLKGYSAAVQNAVSIFRNLLATTQNKNKMIEYFLLLLGVVLGLVFNNLGIIGLLPIIGNLQYTLIVFKYRDNERILKISFLINVVLFIIFNFIIMNFVGVISNSVVVVVTAMSLIRTSKTISE